MLLFVLLAGAQTADTSVLEERAALEALLSSMEEHMVSLGRQRLEYIRSCSTVLRLVRVNHTTLMALRERFPAVQRSYYEGAYEETTQTSRAKQEAERQQIQVLIPLFAEREETLMGEAQILGIRLERNVAQTHAALQAYNAIGEVYLGPTFTWSDAPTHVLDALYGALPQDPRLDACRLAVKQ